MTRRIDLTAEPGKRRWIAAWAAGWTAYIALDALIVTTQSRVRFDRSGAYALADHIPLVMASFALWVLCARRDRMSRGAYFSLHAALAVVAIGLAKAGYVAFMIAFTTPDVWRAILSTTWEYQLVSTILEYSTLLGLILVLQSRRRERESVALMREAELAAARAQLHPHFIFNSLNSIVSLIDSDPARAKEMVVQLSQLLQSSFRGLDDDLVPLERELDMARAYLGIEQLRFGDRLGMSIDADDSTRGMAVPPLVLQPIVENAVRHGIAPHARAGDVRIRARRVGERLRLEVRDSGDGADDDALRDGGHGLLLTRRRLDSVYPSDYELSFDRSGGGFTVSLDLPERHA